jgi:hypothetical protein
VRPFSSARRAADEVPISGRIGIGNYRGGALVPELGWQHRFDDPIPLPLPGTLVLFAGRRKRRGAVARGCRPRDPAGHCVARLIHPAGRSSACTVLKRGRSFHEVSRLRPTRIAGWRMNGISDYSAGDRLARRKFRRVQKVAYLMKSPDQDILILILIRAIAALQ